MKFYRSFKVFFRFAGALTILLLFTVRQELYGRTLQEANKPLDSLLKVLPALKDTARIHTLARLALEYAKTGDADNMRLYKVKAFSEAQNARFPQSQFLLNFYVGCAFRLIQNLDSAILYFEIAEKYAPSDKKYALLGEFYFQKGVAYLEHASSRLAIDNFNKALKFYHTRQNWGKITLLNFALSTVYNTHLNRPVEALNYLETANALIETKKDITIETKFRVFTHLARLYYENGQKERAKAFLARAERLVENLNEPKLKSNLWLDKAVIQYVEKSFEESVESGKKAIRFGKAAANPSFVAQAELTTGNAFEALLMLDSALTYYKHGAIHLNVLNRIYDAAVARLFIAGIYFHQKNWNETRKYLDSADVHFQRLRNFNYLTQCTRLYARIDSAQGDFKNACLRRRAEESYKDSSINEENIKNFEKVYQKFNLERERERLLTEKRQAERTKAIQKNDRDWLQLSGAFIGVLCLLGVGAGLMRKKMAARYGAPMLFISILFFFEILLEVADRSLKYVGLDEPLYRLFPNLLIGAILTPVFHFIQHRLTKK